MRVSALTKSARFFALTAMLAPSVAAAAEPMGWTAPLSCPLESAGWRAARFDGRAANRISCAEGALRLVSQNSISLHHLETPDWAAQARRLSWEWRVIRSGGASDLTEAGADDRNLAVMVTFRFDRDAASFMERAMRPMVELRSGADAPGRVLAYAWAGGAPAALSEGERLIKSPFGGASHQIRILRQGPGPWRREEIDLARDHARAFGESGYRIHSIAIAADTDDLGGSAEVEIRRIRLR